MQNNNLIYTIFKLRFNSMGITNSNLIPLNFLEICKNEIDKWEEEICLKILESLKKDANKCVFCLHVKITYNEDYLNHCDKCQFAKYFGICTEHNSLYFKLYSKVFDQLDIKVTK